MTSADGATQMADECQVKRSKGRPTADSGAIKRRKDVILKNSSIKHSF